MINDALSLSGISFAISKKSTRSHKGNNKQSDVQLVIVNQEPFIKTSKLVVLVELGDKNLQFIIELLDELNYEGETRSFEDLRSAVGFLESIRTA